MKLSPSAGLQIFASSRAKILLLLLLILIMIYIALFLPSIQQRFTIFKINNILITSSFNSYYIVEL